MELECCAEEHLLYCQEALDSTLPNATLNPESELTSLCDPLPNGFGAVLSQPNVDGSEKQVTFASRSLSPAERSTPN